MKSISIKWISLAAMALVFVIMQACNQSEKKNDQVQTEPHDEAHHHDEAAHDDEGHEADRLTLNNGAKWPADAPTNKNAKIIISIGDQFLEKDNKTLEDYKAFGNDVNEAINTMIRECTMKGDADMALHFWFAPLLQDVSTIKAATDTTELDETAHKMIDRMRMYPQYFE